MRDRHLQRGALRALEFPRNRAVSIVSDLKQRRRDQVRAGQGAWRGILRPIGCDRALEELLQGRVDVQIPDSSGRQRRRPSCWFCFKSRALEGSTLKPAPQRRGGEIAPAARQGEGPDSRAEARIGSLLASGFPVAPQIRTPRIERSPIPHAPQAEPERRPGVYTLTLVQVRSSILGPLSGSNFQRSGPSSRSQPRSSFFSRFGFFSRRRITSSTI